MKVSTPQYIDVFKEECHNKIFYQTPLLDEAKDIMLRKSPLTKAPAAVDGKLLDASSSVAVQYADNSVSPGAIDVLTDCIATHLIFINILFYKYVLCFLFR